MYRYSDIPYVDISQNHIDTQLFADKVQPLLLLFKNQRMFTRLKTQMNSQFKIVSDLTNDKRSVYALPNEPLVGYSVFIMIDRDI